MVELFPNATIVAVLALVGCVLGAVLVPYASRRTVAQPLEIAVQDEVRLLLGVLSDLRRLPFLTTLSPQDFAAGANGRIWAALLVAAAPELDPIGEDPTDAQCAEAGEQLAARADEVHLAVQQILAQGRGAHGAGTDLSRLAYLSRLSAEEKLSDDDVIEAAQVVLLTGTGRTKLAGSALVQPTAYPDSIDPANPPLHRVHTPPTRLRRVLSSAVCGAACSLVYGLAVATGLTGASLWLAVAALVVLAAGSLVISLVDLDTLYVDLRTFLVTAVGAGSLTVAAVGASGLWGRLVAGVVMVAATAVFFELVNRIHRAVRGVDGQGLGDTLIIIATVGIPPALMGNWVLGYYSVMAGIVAVLLGWLIGAARGKVTRSTPMAFGPYLAAGWVLGWAAYLIIS